MAELTWLHWGTLAIVSDWAIRLVMLPIVPTRRSPEAAKGWLLLIFFLPWVGLVAYLLIGRPRLPQWRLDRLARFIEQTAPLRARLATPAPAVTAPAHILAPSAQLATQLGTLPVAGGNAVELHADYAVTLERIAADIDASRASVNLSFYIFADDARTALVIDALGRAAARGVACRVLVDAYGSRPYVGRLLPRLQSLGVDARRALPFRWRKPERLDLRNHRKIVVVDGAIGYTGSQNMVAPDFKPGLRYSELMIRAIGPVVLQLQALFAADWFVETGDYIGDAAFPKPVHAGSVSAQVLPSGPSSATQRAERMVVNLIYAATREVILTTPYFIPDQPLQEALETAAQRGVDVHLIVDHQVDQILVGNAQRSYYESLLTAGVRIHAYEEAFLHTKAISIDRMFAWVGSANFDRRSFQLNEEVIALIYDAGIAGELVAIQQRYMQGSAQIDLEAWRRRPFARVLLENLTRLVSPLL